MLPKDHIDRVIELFRCHEGDPERSAILFVDHHSNVRGMSLIEGKRDVLELPIGQIALQSLALRTRRVVIVHTHPSGDPRPSRQDVSATRLLCTRLRRQGQRLLDHIILTNSRYFSFRANRLL